MTDEELDRLDELAAKATPGPWVSFPEDDSPFVGQVRSAFMDIEGGAPFTHVADMPAYDERDADMAFIAAARLAVPDLTGAVRAERQRAGRLSVENERQAALIDELAEALRNLLNDTGHGVFARGPSATRIAEAALEKVGKEKR